MLIYIIKWLKGFLLIEISGNAKDRFINICSNHGIVMWNVISENNVIKAYISKSNYKALSDYIKKTDVKITVIDKKGLPFFFYKYRKRKCFIIGMLLFFSMIYAFSLFIWDININGEYIYTKEQILKDIKKNYVPLGTLKKKIDCNDLEKKLRERYDKIAWISCEIKGTQLNIELTETIETSKIKEETNPCNIVAVKDGIITDIIVRSGKITAHKGDEVKKGDILITGAINIYNDYDELIETDYIPASGEVYGISKYTYDDSFEINYFKKQYNDNSKKYYSIIVGNKMYTPYTPKKSKQNTDIVSVDKKLRIGKTFYFPLGIKESTIKEFTSINTSYSTEEAKEKATKKLNLYLSELSKKGVEILENNVTIDINDGVCHTYGTIVTKEPIGVPSTINITNQGEKPR